jgi:hypothetical protein
MTLKSLELFTSPLTRAHLVTMRIRRCVTHRWLEPWEVHTPGISLLVPAAIRARMSPFSSLGFC